ncbi:MAG: hypothetical protein PHH41_00590 [Sulfurimonas sp.]|nr:hypothetical protein [Sulfurimonas sp.]
MRTFLLSCFVLFFGITISAQETQLKEDVLEQMLKPRVTFDSSYISDAEVSSGGGSVAVAKNRIAVANKLGSISYTNWSFLWSNIEALPFGNGVENPIEQMHSVKISGNIPYFINEKWFWLTSLSLSSTFEKEMQDSYGAGIFSFASYKLSENHTIQMGAFANYHPTSSFGLPVMSYSYRARQHDGLQFVLGFPRTYVGYYVSDKTLLRFGMIYSQSLIKLSDTSTIEAAGYIEAKDYMSNLGISYTFDSQITLETDILYSIKREFTLYNSGADEGESYTIAPSLGAALRLKYLF